MSMRQTLIVPFEHYRGWLTDNYEFITDNLIPIPSLHQLAYGLLINKGIECNITQLVYDWIFYEDLDNTWALELTPEHRLCLVSMATDLRDTLYTYTQKINFEDFSTITVDRDMLILRH